jgi:hypothetical protein
MLTGRFRKALLTSAVAMLVACDSPSQPSRPEFRGGVLATFDVVGQRFSVWITNRTAIDQALALQRGAARANIPVGRVRRGAGQGSHNIPYRWHMDPEDVQFAEIAIELCDGTPRFVEENIDYYVDTVARYCPWSARLLGLDDYRSITMNGGRP